MILLYFGLITGEFGLEFQSILPAGSLINPVGIVHADDARLFLIEQTGTMRILKDNILLEAPFLDVSDRVVVGVEQGLLGLAFAPDYATSGQFFVTYTQLSDGAAVLARFSVSADPDLADPASEVILLTIPQPSPIHQMHALQFGLDSTLFISVGDGGPRWDPDCRGQDTSSLLGKILRIEVINQSNPPFYQIPADNPFVAIPTYRPEIYAIGLRNSWRIGYDASSGSMVIGDVGQDDQEELNLLLPGENYGWSVMEGTSCFGLSSCSAPTCLDPGLTMPVFTYAHDPECAVIAGPRISAASILGSWGLWITADFCSGKAWLLQSAEPTWIEVWSGLLPPLVTSFGTDARHNIFSVHLDGSMNRLLSPWSTYWPNWHQFQMVLGEKLDILHLSERAGH